MTVHVKQVVLVRYELSSHRKFHKSPRNEQNVTWFIWLLTSAHLFSQPPPPPPPPNHTHTHTHTDVHFRHLTDVDALAITCFHSCYTRIRTRSIPLHLSTHTHGSASQHNNNKAHTEGRTQSVHRIQMASHLARVSCRALVRCYHLPRTHSFQRAKALP